MLSGELAPARRGPGLVEHGRALRRGLAEMDGVEAKVLSLVLDAMDFFRIGENAARAIAQRRIVFPASFPELVDDFHVFVGDVVAVVVTGLLVLAGAFRGAVEIAGDDIPPHASFREMIERRHAPGERIGRLVGEIGRDAEAEVFGHRGHRRDHQHGIVDRRLRGVAHRRLVVAAKDVVDPEHVGEKQAVEPPALQRPGEIKPIGQAVVVGGAVARMGPQSRRLMCDAIHRERVEPDFLLHARQLSKGRHRASRAGLRDVLTAGFTGRPA